MKQNITPNNTEYLIPDNALMVTKTDMNGILTYVSEDFETVIIYV